VKKPVYRTVTVERTVAATRDEVWQALLRVLAAAGYETEGDPAPHGPGATIRVRIPGYELLERTVSLEAPWRRVYHHTEGAPGGLAQGTTALRDDGDACHVAWAVIVEVPAGTEDEVDAFVAAARPVLERALAAVAAEAGDRSGAGVSGGPRGTGTPS
jgi:hypothetical protein